MTTEAFSYKTLIKVIMPMHVHAIDFLTMNWCTRVLKFSHFGAPNLYVCNMQFHPAVKET